MNIYVGNISFSMNEGNLRELFEEYGEVSSAQILQDRYTGRSRGFGFVEMPNQSEAEAAIEGLNQKEIMGRPLRVNEARPREDRRPPRY
ncbi:MAG: RNA-binding protein [Candidatus Neomarinimicrobiota bacterium]|nr:MAG: RNA-binding protein [Candidatus Neomarinimicrobiota bacterium]